MHEQSPLTELCSSLNVTTFTQWSTVGAGIGVCAWHWGTSPLPKWGFMLTTGFGAWLVVQALVVTVLAIVARTGANRASALALGYFGNFQPKLVARLLRAVAAFFGVAVVAALCWWDTGSLHARDVALIGARFSITLAYIWAGMTLLGRDLSQTPLAS